MLFFNTSLQRGFREGDAPRLTNQDKWGTPGRELAARTNDGEHISVGVSCGVCTLVREGRDRENRRTKPS